MNWTSEIPSTTGYYWVRTHGGVELIGWLDVRHDPPTLAMCAGPTIDLTEDFRDTQSLEFLPEPITP